MYLKNEEVKKLPVSYYYDFTVEFLQIKQGHKPLDHVHFTIH